MKTALALVAQFVLFFVVFLGGSLAAPLHVQWFISHPTQTSIRFFVPDGLLLMSALAALILLMELAAKKIRSAGIATGSALLAALALGLMAKFGFVTHSLY